MASDTGLGALEDKQAILVFCVCLLFIAANVYVIVSRVIWMVKFRASDEELENYILQDEKCVKYLKKVTDNPLSKRLTGGLYIIEAVALFVFLYLFIAFTAVVSIVKGFNYVTNNEFNPFAEHAATETQTEYKYAFEIAPNQYIYVGHDDKFYDDYGRPMPYHLIGRDVYDDQMNKAGEIIGDELTLYKK